jgi:hypothetical protein
MHDQDQESLLPVYASKTDSRLADILRQMEEQQVVLVTLTVPHILLVIV